MRSVLILFLLISSLIYSQNQKIQLVTDDNFPPFSFTEGENTVGFDIDILKEIEKRLGMEIEVISYPWSRVLMMAETGLADGAFSLFKSPEREQWSTYSKLPIHYSSYHVFTLIENKFEYKDLTDLKGKIDCYIGNYLTYISKNYQEKFYMIPTPIVAARPSYLVFSKESKLENIVEIKGKIDFILNDLYQDGTIDRITLKYTYGCKE